MTRKLSERRPVTRLALSRTDVALAIGVSASSVDKMVTEGALPPPRKWHSRKLWLVSEIEAFLNEWPVDGQETFEDTFTGLDGEPLEATREAANISFRKGFLRKHSDAMDELHRDIGFDPTTMNEDEIPSLMRDAQEQWKASLPGTPLGKREREALAQLAPHGIGASVDTTKVKNCGPDTVDRLLARGLIEIRPRAKYPDRIGYYVLTQAGFDEWSASGNVSL